MRGWSAIALLAVAASIPAACSSDGSESAPPVTITYSTPTEAGTIAPTDVTGLAATVETDPVPHSGDAADDPAIWVDSTNPGRSTIIGTDKDGGLAVYDLEGNELEYRPDGDMDNVDLRSGFRLGVRSVTLVTAGNRSDNSIAVYAIDESTRRLVPVSARKIVVGISTYGSCMYRSATTGKFYYVVDSKDGEVEQWELFDEGGGKVDAKRVRTFDVGSQTEGCVADDELGDLYIGEESRGIWKYHAEPQAGEDRSLVDSTEGGHLEPDVEGLTIAYGRGGDGYLLASSQGDNTFVVYLRGDDNSFVTSFEVEGQSGIDGVEDTDGIDVTTADLGPAFPSGVFVVQDGKNDEGNQNYKLIPWHAIIGMTSLAGGAASDANG